MGGQGDPHEIVQEIEIWLYKQMVHPTLARQPDLLIIDKKPPKTCQIVDFAVMADHRVKLKEIKKKDKYLDLARELKKLWNMKVTVTPIGVIGGHGTVTKEDWEIRRRVETI